jgi:DNA-binding NtrC family response regulator
MTGRILIVDDEEASARLTEIVLAEAGLETERCHSAKAALEALSERGADVVISDLKMPGMDGLELLREIHRQHPWLPVIVLTGFSSISSAVAAMREGAFDYVTKPVDGEELGATVGRALKMTELERENRYLRSEVASRYTPDSFVAESEHSKTVLAMVRRVARSRSTVLIQGESGTGKELVARLLHYWSDRVGKPFVAVNCKAFAPGVLESELFGHEKGAFTGAAGEHAGCFERASGGTLFLDEIGEIGLDFQAKLLRVLQEGEVLRVGGTKPRKLDVRVVAATNRMLQQEVSAGNFREDLFFRLNVIPVTLAPLRERVADILPIADHFLRHYADSEGRRLSFAPDAAQALVSHRWRGNIRELENVVERAVVLAHGNEITLADLMLEPERPPSLQGDWSGLSLQEHLDRATISRINDALKAAGGSRAEAARALGIDRTTLYRLMRRLGVQADAVQA